MDFANINTYKESPNRAFEALCNQLFEQWVRATYIGQVSYFTTVNGAGGDGGVEAYAELTTGHAVGLQAKWFRGPIQDTQIKQIRKSVVAACQVRPHLQHYVICVSRALQSKKMGPGKKPITNTEEGRVLALQAELLVTYPGLTVEFWPEHTLIERLKLPGNEGITRFWFEREEHSPVALKQRFDLAKAGWLLERYSPDLHCQGIIQEAVEKILFSPSYRRETHQQVTDRSVLLADTQHLIALFIDQAEAAPAFIAELTELSRKLLDYQEQLQKLAQALLVADDSLLMPHVAALNVGPVINTLNEGQYSNRVRGIRHKLAEILEAVHDAQIHEYLKAVCDAQRPHNFVVLGRPGTGKTHGVARAVELRLADGYPALIIQGRTSPSESWGAILKHALGGLSNWTEAELFSAFEAMAARKDVERATVQAKSFDEPFLSEPTRVFICIDGVDESAEPAEWQQRVRELHVWLASNPRLRFVITSRSYPPANLNPCGLTCDNVNVRLLLPDRGDVPLAELAPKYLQHYGIEYSTQPWLPEAFQDALSLRLFAQERAGQDLADQHEPITTNLSGLLHNKIEQIEAAFVNNPLIALPAEQQLAYKGLLSITNQLQLRAEIEHNELCQQLVTDLSGWLDLSKATRMIKGYADHGLILLRSKPGPSKMAPSVTYVTFAFQQPLIDYLLACDATDAIIKANSKDVPKDLLRRQDWNALNLTAVALLNDHGILVGEDDYWVHDLDAARLDAIAFAALIASGGATIEKHLPVIARKFRHSVVARNLVLKEFLLPTAYRPDVEIVLPVVHEVLAGFSTVFERDEFWAGPASHDYEADEENIGQLLSRESLSDYDRATGRPLLFAWSLATVNNTYREHARRELTHWGWLNTGEFVQVLDLVFFQGDPQIQEDLATVAMGIMSLVMKPSEGAQALAQWILTNIFSPDNIVKLLNSVVRACARVAIERAVVTGNCTEEAARVVRPPYQVADDLLPLNLWHNEEGIGHRGERFPIVHDLAWYVLEKSYKGFMDLPSSGKDRTKAKGYSLQARYEEEYGEIGGAYDFAMSAALAYIASLGYNRLTGPGTTDKTHGSLSEISTLEEKYTWLAVHHLQGHMADHLPYKEYGQVHDPVLDYRLFLDTTNPANELSPDAEADAEWYIPVEISPDLPTGSAEELPQRIKAWIERKDEPDFATWLTLPGLVPAAVSGIAPLDWLPLHLKMRLPERQNFGTTSLEISCGWVAKNEWDAMYRYAEGNMEKFAAQDHWAFNHLENWQARPTGARTSVKDIVLGTSPPEGGATVALHGTRNREWTCYKTITRVNEHSVEHGDATYLIPSQIIRQHLGIVDTDRQGFYTQSEQPVACYQEVEEFDNSASQTLLVADRQLFEKVSKKHGLRPFWLFCQFQSLTIEAIQNHRDIHGQNIRCWFVWVEKEEIKYRLYHDDISM